MTEVGKYKKKEFCLYSSTDRNLDEFLGEHIGERLEYAELWSVVKQMLILSHGQSCVERGFSENKDILSNNMLQDSLIAIRRAYDGIKQQDGPIEDSISEELLTSCTHARQRYHSHLEDKKRLAERTDKERQKKCIEEELCQSRKKKRQLQTIAEELINDANALAKDAEFKNSMSLLVKSNASRQKSGKKRKAIEDEDKNIDLLQKKLKSV